MGQTVFKMPERELTEEEKYKYGMTRIAKLFNDEIADKRSWYMKEFRKNAMQYRKKLITAKEYDKRDRELRKGYDEVCKEYALALVDWEEEK